MSDDFKKFMREFYSQQQHWRIMKFIEHVKALFTWKQKDEASS